MKKADNAGNKNDAVRTDPTGGQGQPPVK